MGNYTNCGSIASTLYSNWALTGNGTKTNIAFGSLPWFNSQLAYKAQITVTDLVETNRLFLNLDGSGTMVNYSHPRFLVNCWVPIPRGKTGTAEVQLADDMRYEVARIITQKNSSIGSLRPLVPLDLGTPHHELDAEPRILRFELTLVGAQNKVQA